MATKQIRGLRAVVISLLVVLALQFEFGMAVNISNPPSLPPFSFSIQAVLNALNQIGPVGIDHAGLGIFLTIFSLVNLIMALTSRIRSVQIMAGLGFISMVVAAAMGLSFTLSGFQSSDYTHGMATNFLLTFIFHFLELYFLKPSALRQAS